MDFSQKLSKFGLSEKEARVYLACLELGPSSVMTIAVRAELKRPTTYLVLDDLVAKGLVSIVPREKKKLFVAESPERIRGSLEEKLYEIQNILPQLRMLYNQKAARPAVVLYEGKEAIVKAYQEIVVSGEKEILSFFSIDDISKEFFDSFQLFIKMMKDHPSIISKEIAYASNLNHYYLKTVDTLPNHQIRLVRNKHRFFTDNIIYLDKIAIFSFAKRFVTVIESQDIVDSFRALFGLAWQGAEPLRKT